MVVGARLAGRRLADGLHWLAGDVPAAEGAGDGDEQEEDGDGDGRAHVLLAVVHVDGADCRPRAARAGPGGVDPPGAVPALVAQEDGAVRRAVGAWGCCAGWHLSVWGWEAFYKGKGRLVWFCGVLKIGPGNLRMLYGI